MSPEPEKDNRTALAVGCFAAGFVTALVLVLGVTTINSLVNSQFNSPSKKEREAAVGAPAELAPLAETSPTTSKKKPALSPQMERKPGSRETPAIVAPSRGMLEVPLEIAKGYPPTGWSYQPGMPYKLSSTPPVGVRTAPPGENIHYGTVPLAGKPVDFAIAPAQTPGTPATLFVDRNRDGDFTNDTPASYRGTGTSMSAGFLEMDVVRPNGESFPYTVWVWTTFGNATAKGGPAFNFYTHSYRKGAMQLTVNGELRTVAILAGDPSNVGEFNGRKVLVDWNGNGKPEEPEWLAEGEVHRTGTSTLRLVKVTPFAASAAFEINGEGDNAAEDTLTLLQQEPVAGNAPPALAFDTKGLPVDLAEYKGKVVLVDFWATWCGPCVRDLPHVKNAYEKFHDKGFEIIGVSLDKDANKLSEFVRMNQMPWRQIQASESWESPLVKRWRVKGIPATFLIGKDGKIAQVGASGASGESLARAVEGELKK